MRLNFSPFETMPVDKRSIDNMIIFFIMIVLAFVEKITKRLQLSD